MSFIKDVFVLAFYDKMVLIERRFVFTLLLSELGGKVLVTSTESTFKLPTIFLSVNKAWEITFWNKTKSVRKP